MRSPILTACTLASMVLSAGAANLLENSSFELPAITGRTVATAGGNPAVGADPTSFASLSSKSSGDAKELQVGLTDQIARTGKQSLFVDFLNVEAAGVRAALATKLIPVKENQAYRIAIWARIDRKRPLALDESRPQLWMEIRFLKEDQTTEAAEAIAGSQAIPGDVVPGGPHSLVFTSLKWKEFSAEIETPAETKFVQISWYCITSDQEGKTDGIVYFDDASFEETEAVVEEDDATTETPGSENVEAAATTFPAAPAPIR